jgi:hypothetical protein
MKLGIVTSFLVFVLCAVGTGADDPRYPVTIAWAEKTAEPTGVRNLPDIAYTRSEPVGSGLECLLQGVAEDTSGNKVQVDMRILAVDLASDKGIVTGHFASRSERNTALAISLQLKGMHGAGTVTAAIYQPPPKGALQAPRKISNTILLKVRAEP